MGLFLCRLWIEKILMAQSLRQLTAKINGAGRCITRGGFGDSKHHLPPLPTTLQSFYAPRI